MPYHSRDPQLQGSPHREGGSPGLAPVVARYQQVGAGEDLKVAHQRRPAKVGGVIGRDHLLLDAALSRGLRDLRIETRSAAVNPHRLGKPPGKFPQQVRLHEPVPMPGEGDSHKEIV